MQDNEIPFTDNYFSEIGEILNVTVGTLLCTNCFDQFPEVEMSFKHTSYFQKSTIN